MAHSTTPIVGINLEDVVPADESKDFTRLGIIVHGDDGHEYILAEASANIAADTVSVLTEPALTMAAGAGDWTSPSVALVTGDLAWFQKTAI